jgi:hypothetical protein
MVRAEELREAYHFDRCVARFVSYIHDVLRAIIGAREMPYCRTRRNEIT